MNFSQKSLTCSHIVILNVDDIQDFPVLPETRKYAVEHKKRRNYGIVSTISVDYKESTYCVVWFGGNKSNEFNYFYPRQI